MGMGHGGLHWPFLASAGVWGGWGGDREGSSGVKERCSQEQMGEEHEVGLGSGSYAGSEPRTRVSREQPLAVYSDLSHL